MLSYSYGVHALSIALLAVGSVIRAYVLAQCWKWFALPLGAPSIGMAHAYGLAMLTLLATYMWPTNGREVIETASGKREADGEESATYIGLIVAKHWLMSLFTLDFAYVAHYFMTF